MSDRRSSTGSHSDEPPLSRLFIIGPKSLTEDDYRKAFSKFGAIEEIWIVKDRTTKESKGVTYIKFSKTSEAAKALEALNGVSLVNGTRRIKIMIAASREKGSKREANEEEKSQRLFVIVPKTMTDDELYDDFKQFGDLEYASVIKDRSTRESKGVAYVKFYKFSDAAMAFEQCDKKYKPVFAEPKKTDAHKREDKNVSSSLIPQNSASLRALNSLANTSLPLPAINNCNDSYTKLTVIANSSVTEDQLWRLFDVVPGMDYCQLNYENAPQRPSRAVAEVAYTHPQWAAHAKEKLHGFEYPPGFRLIVKPDYEGRSSHSSEPSQKRSLMNLAETIAQATSIIQAAGINPATLNLPNSSKELITSTSVKLPPSKPLANADDEMVARCFLVCTPTALEHAVLRNLFCRFGNLIEVYMLPNKNCGYAKYADASSAEEAIEVLHGAEINGIRLKVMKAEEQRKRPRIDDVF